MSLRDKLAAKASEVVNDKSAGWLESLIDKGREFVDAEVGDQDSKVAATAALAVLSANRDPFLRLGLVGFAELVSFWESGDEAEARRLYLATEATYAERRAAMQAAGDAAAADADARNAAWLQVMSALREMGGVGLKFVGQILIKALSL